MLTVILTILKWIGITILVIVGILLLALCLILFVPIRYKADGFYKETYQVRARVSWLLHIVTVAFHYEKDQAFHMKLRIFGIPVFDNLKKKEKTQKRSSKKKKPKKPMEEQAEPEIIASSVSEMDDTDTKQQEKVSKPEASNDNEKENEKRVERETEQAQETSDDVDKLGLIGKIKLVLSKAFGVFRNIKYTIHRICDTMKRIMDNITYYVELFKKDSTKAALAACKKQLVRILKNLKPQKFQMNLHIGMEDPATMGDILGVWGMLYPIHQGHIDICPDFEQAVLEGEFYCKGRVTVYIYIWTVIIILFDKDIRRLRKCLVRKGK